MFAGFLTVLVPAKFDVTGFWFNSREGVDSLDGDHFEDEPGKTEGEIYHIITEHNGVGEEKTRPGGIAVVDEDVIAQS
jgi:hypothetical protein